MVDVARQAAGAARGAAGRARVLVAARRAPVTAGLVTLVVVCAYALQWGVRDPEAVERWASTNIANLHHHPGAALVASAFVSADGVGWVLLAMAVSCAVLETRTGWRRMLAVVAAGHVIASLVTEGAVRLAILAHRAPHAAARQLDVGISYVAYTAVGAALHYAPPRWRRLVTAAAFGYVSVALVLSGDMTSWGHALSLLIGVLCWPLLRDTRTPRPAPARRRHHIAPRARLAGIGALATVGTLTACAPAALLAAPGQVPAHPRRPVPATGSTGPRVPVTPGPRPRLAAARA